MAASSKEALMLKDYLMDDLSSCSSNGFRSFPRRQCGSTIRVLLEIDLKERDSAAFSAANPVLRRSRSKRAALTSLSAFLRASEEIFIAFKNLSFPSAKSSSSQHRRDHYRHRSRSLKLLSKSFWKQSPDQAKPEIRMWKTSSVLHKEDEKPLDINPSTSINAPSKALLSNRVSTNTVYSHTRWSECEFKFENSVSPYGIPGSSTDAEAVDSDQQSPSEVAGRGAGVSPEPSTKKWSNEAEKEQFSPVSVLDCPFQDEEEASSPSPCSFQEAEQQLIQKIRRFEDLAQTKPLMKPLDLQQCFLTSELEEEPELQVQTDHKAIELLNLIKANNNWSNSCASASENLVLDFFREKIEEATSNLPEILNVAEDWLNGLSEDVWRGWEVEEGREAYGREMEKGGRWRKMEEGMEEEGLEMEDEVWSGLVDELLVELL